MNGEAGKGSAIRQSTDWKKFEAHYDSIFKNKGALTGEDDSLAALEALAEESQRLGLYETSDPLHK
jgi:hypothetical protein